MSLWRFGQGIKLGDAIALNLTVEAESDVEVFMPAFGEALGQFNVVAFVPREETTEEGQTIASQRYDLQATRSGDIILPSLRIDFVDRRTSNADSEKKCSPTKFFLLLGCLKRMRHSSLKR